MANLTSPDIQHPITVGAKSKGKGKAIDPSEPSSEPESDLESDSSSSSESSSDSTGSDSDSDSSDDITPEYLNSLLDKARRNAVAKNKQQGDSLQEESEEDVIVLDKEKSERPIPSLDPGTLPPAYFTLGDSRRERPSAVNDPDSTRTEREASGVPAPPIPPPELAASGKPLTKKQRKALKKQTTGPDWFDMPAPAEADLPRLHREYEALRLRNQLDPKRFYRKDEGEGKGIKGLPKYFAIGRIVATDTPFGTASSDNLPRSHRKRTLVDELLDDAEAKRYAKKKFDELQKVRGAKGKATLAAKKAMRKPKW